MKRYYVIVLFLCQFFILFGCVDKNKNDNDIKASDMSIINKSENDLNISILLDLSDRIDPQKYPNPAMEYYKRDVAYMDIVANNFVNNLQRKKVREMDDFIQVYFDPEPQNPDINTLAHELKFEVLRENASIELLEEIKDAYLQLPVQIYESAINDNNYVGSDTWGFFQNKVKDYCIKEDHRNVLILLTDGYMYHENTKRSDKNRTSFLTPNVIRSFHLDNKNWKSRMESEDYGFIPATSGLENLEVLVLGINPNPKNAYEGDIIQEYWSKWLGEMGINKYEIKESALPANMEQVIENFLKETD